MSNELEFVSWIKGRNEEVEKAFPTTQKRESLGDFIDRVKKETREATLNEMREAVREIWRCDFYCQHEYCDKEINANNCMECLYEAIARSFEIHKEMGVKECKGS